MTQSSQIQLLWDHTLTADIITISYDSYRQFSISVSTQVLKLVSRYASQSSKDEISCLLIGNCDNKECNRVNIDIDRIECNLANYLSDNQLICTNDICVPLKIFKNKSNAVYKEEDYKNSFDEYVKSFEDISMSLLLSKVMLLKAYAGFSGDQLKTNNHSTTLNWIDFKLLIPDFHLTLSPINKVPIFRSALVSSFEGHIYSNQIVNMFTFGYLSIDQSGKVHFLLHSDERALISSLVGIWVHGVSDASDVLLVAACMKYILIKHKNNKIAKPPFPFLLAQFTNRTKESILFYDVKWPKGPSEDHDSSLSHIKFKLLSSLDNLDRYYQSPNEKALSFITSLSPVTNNSRALETVSNALETFMRTNYSKSIVEKDDNIPRFHGNNCSNVHSITANEFKGFEVSDISLLVNDMSTHSAESSHSRGNGVSYTNNLRLSAYPAEINPQSQPTIDVKYRTSSQNDEAIPRPLLRKQHISSSTIVTQDPKIEIPDPRYQPVQFIHQPIFPYPAMYQPNPYMIFPSNMYLQGPESNLPVVSKPPYRPRRMELKSKQTKDEPSKLDVNKASNRKIADKHSKVSHINMNSRVDRAVITDVTNTSSKRILQLDKEEDLATLEFLVQQIINQRHQDKPTMVSTGVNTSAVNIDQQPQKLIEVATDLPSLCVNTICSRCQQTIDDCHEEEEMNREDGNRSSARVDKENSFYSLDLGKFDRPSNPTHDQTTEDQRQRDQQWFEESEESAHYSELLNNLEEFVKQTRHSVHDIVQQPSKDDKAIMHINILEEAVQNLRELDINGDCEGQYLETMRNVADPQSNDVINCPSTMVDQDSFEATILQQKINYVSIFLNNSIMSCQSPADSRKSLNEQSFFIDSLARKYLDKYSNQNTYASTNTAFNGDMSSATVNYLHKYNLIDGEKQSDTFYSSIRHPDGKPMPSKKCAISSTPAPNCNELLAACKKSRLPNPVPDRDSWSGVRILDGLAQQPSILKATVTSTRSSQSSSLSQLWPHLSHQRHLHTATATATATVNTTPVDTVLDLDKLRLLPKYL